MRSRRGRVVWSLADQGLSSASNFLVLALVIRSESLATVGVFGIVYASYFLVLTIVRGLTTEALTVRHVDPTSQTWNRLAGDCLGAGLVLAVALAVALAGFGFVVDGQLGNAFLTLAVVILPLVLQDAWRLLLFAQQLPARACLIDAVFFMSEATMCILLVRDGRESMNTLLLAWGVAAGFGAVVGAALVRIAPRPKATSSWLRSTRDLGPAFAVDQLAGRGAEQAVLAIISSLGGLAATGSYTAARSLFAPLTTLQTGINAFALPEVARLAAARRADRLRRLLSTMCLSIAVLSLVAGLLLAQVPDSVGRTLYQDNWAPAQALIPAVTALNVANAIFVGLWVGLRGLRAARQVLLTRLAFGLVAVVAATIGVLLGGANGATIGLAMSTFLMCATMFVQVRRRLRRMDQDV